MELNPFEQGRKAFRRGKVVNPFRCKLQRRKKSWEYGFNKAYFYNLNKLN